MGADRRLPPALYVNDGDQTWRRPRSALASAHPLIVGGLPKGDSLDECAPHFGHVVHALHHW
jgi:UDP-N-acetylmuramoylalanine--D-glutamate ligase